MKVDTGIGRKTWPSKLMSTSCQDSSTCLVTTLVSLVTAGFALGSNMMANCGNTTAFVGVTIFASCCALPDLILPSLHLHGCVYFNTFLGMLVMSVFALGCAVRWSALRLPGSSSDEVLAQHVLFRYWKGAKPARPMSTSHHVGSTHNCARWCQRPCLVLPVGVLRQMFAFARQRSMPAWVLPCGCESGRCMNVTRVSACLYCPTSTIADETASSERPAALWQPSTLCREHRSSDTSLARHGPWLAKRRAPDQRAPHGEEEDLRHVHLLRVSPVQCAPRDGHHRV